MLDEIIKTTLDCRLMFFVTFSWLQWYTYKTFLISYMEIETNISYFCHLIMYNIQLIHLI